MTEPLNPLAPTPAAPAPMNPLAGDPSSPLPPTGTEPPAPAPAPATPPAPAPGDPEPTPDPEDPENNEPLGEAGRRALRDLRARHRDLTAERDRLKHQLAQAQGRVATVESLRRALLQQAVVAAASGHLADPLDATRLLDLSDVTVGDDGSVDTEALRQRVEELVKAKPYLAPAPTLAAPRPLPNGGGQRPGIGFNEVVQQAIRGGR